MQPFPHRYTIRASAEDAGDVTLEGDRLPPLQSAPPSEFGGPGDRWSPETLAVAAVADCFVLTFRGIAGLSKLSWISVTCEVTGTVSRVEQVTQFTEFLVRARLKVPLGTDEERARRLLTKAEETCLVTRSLTASFRLEAEVETVEPDPARPTDAGRLNGGAT